MIKLLLTGASGMLGKQVFSKLVDEKKYEIFTVSRKALEISKKHFIEDIGNYEQLMHVLHTCKPEIVINCAAYVDVNYCEANPGITNLLHNDAVANISSYPSVKSVYYISTDSVFNGQQGNYTEEDEPNPLNYYALSKLKGEKTALESDKDVYIIRTNIIGFNSISGMSLFEWAYQNLLMDNSINGFSNVYFNPLYVGDLADMIISFMRINCNRGIYNFASNARVSKYTVLYKIANVFGLKTDLINPVELDISQLKALRPLNTTLDTSKIINLGIKVPTIDASINNLYKDFLKYGIRI